MLFTRCPDCDTTFRVTDDALRKANGQVRCGRCSSVFNAYAERREEPTDAIADVTSQRALAETPVRQTKADPGAQQALAETLPKTAPTPQTASAEASELAEPGAPNPPLRLVPPSPPQDTPQLEPDDDPLGALSVASVVAQLEQSAVDSGADVGDLGDLEGVRSEALPPSQVEAVLETEQVGELAARAQRVSAPQRLVERGSCLRRRRARAAGDQSLSRRAG